MKVSEALSSIYHVCDTLESVRRECIYAISDYQKLNQEYHEHKLTYEDIQEDYIKARFAENILEILGYEIDYYFCNSPILKEINLIRKVNSD